MPEDPAPKKPTRRRNRARSEEGAPVVRSLRFPPSRDALLVAEAKRQGISVAAVIDQALVARGIFPGVDETG